MSITKLNFFGGFLTCVILFAKSILCLAMISFLLLDARPTVIIAFFKVFNASVFCCVMSLVLFCHFLLFPSCQFFLLLYHFSSAHWILDFVSSSPLEFASSFYPRNAVSTKCFSLVVTLLFA